MAGGPYSLHKHDVFQDRDFGKASCRFIDVAPHKLRLIAIGDAREAGPDGADDADEAHYGVLRYDVQVKGAGNAVHKRPENAADKTCREFRVNVKEEQGGGLRRPRAGGKLRASAGRGAEAVHRHNVARRLGGAFVSIHDNDFTSVNLVRPAESGETLFNSRRLTVDRDDD